MDSITPHTRPVLSGRYAVERELGRGGMATVYLARELKHDRPVALKLFEPELASSLDAERFLREVQITAGLQHPHIVPLLDSGEHEGRLYYVMPYLEGESLRERLLREPQLPVAEALRIACEVADALSYAHARGVVHRDIKPGNILLAVGHAVVADFGIARAYATCAACAPAGTGQLTLVGLPMGTPAYMSPEQATGLGEVDGRSDVYSLGCVLYEMLAGRPPFTGATISQIIEQHRTAEVAPIQQYRPEVPTGVAQVLRRTLAKAPAQRYASAGEFLDALRQEAAADPHLAVEMAAVRSGAQAIARAAPPGARVGGAARGPSGLRSLLEELRRRKVFRVGAGYAVVAWFLIQAATATFYLGDSLRHANSCGAARPYLDAYLAGNEPAHRGEALGAALDCAMRVGQRDRVPALLAEAVTYYQGQLPPELRYLAAKATYGQTELPADERFQRADAAFAAARAAGQPLALDWYADWCISCKVMEREVFVAPQVAAALARFRLVRFDLTAGTPEQRALLDRYRLFGPPALLLFAADGSEQADLRVIGETDAATLAARLEQAGQRR